MSIVADIINPYRIWIEAAVLAAVLGFGTWLYFHVEGIGEKKIEVKVAAALQAQKAIDKQDIDNARLTLAALQKRLDGALAAPAPVDPDIHIRVCDDPVRSVAASKVPGPGSGSHDAVRPPAGMEDPNPPASRGSVEVTDITEQVLLLAGARIAYLQGYIEECQAKGFCDASTSR